MRARRAGRDREDALAPTRTSRTGAENRPAPCGEDRRIAQTRGSLPAAAIQRLQAIAGNRAVAAMVVRSRGEVLDPQPVLRPDAPTASVRGDRLNGSGPSQDGRPTLQRSFLEPSPPVSKQLPTAPSVTRPSPVATRIRVRPESLAGYPKVLALVEKYEWLEHEGADTTIRRPVLLDLAAEIRALDGAVPGWLLPRVESELRLLRLVATAESSENQLNWFGGSDPESDYTRVKTTRMRGGGQLPASNNFIVWLQDQGKEPDGNRLPSVLLRGGSGDPPS